MKMTTLIGFAVLFAVGCGGNDVGSVSGTVHGGSLPISDAISASVSGTTTTGVAYHEAIIIMANAADLCGDANTNTSHPNEKGVIISLGDVNGTTVTTPTAGGAYTIYQTGTPPAKAATLDVSVSDATCNNVAASSAKATSGTITLSSVSGNAFDGSFDVALDSGDHITGSFSPRECPAIQTVLTSTTKGPCT